MKNHTFLSFSKAIEKYEIEFRICDKFFIELKHFRQQSLLIMPSLMPLLFLH